MSGPQSEPLSTFLSGVLSQRGPNALPYVEHHKWHIRQQLVALISAYPSLEPKTATYTHNNGHTVNLLQIDGTVPMPFQGVTYNIPVVIWLMDTYPRDAPCVYLNPTRDMIIKRPHPYVNPSGLVTVPYLQNWIFPGSNLLDLARNLSDCFAQDPPLYSSQRPRPNPTPTPTPNPNPNPSLSPSLSNSSYSYTRPVIPPTRPYPPSPYGSGGGGVGSFSRVTEDPTEVYKRNAINKIVEMVHGDMAGLRKAREAEMDGLFNAQVALRQRSEQLGRGLKEMLDEKEGLEQQLQMVLMNSDVLEGWLRENEGKGKGGGGEVDDAFECVDGLSKQMLESTAADLAIEDVVYSLDKAVQDGAVPFDQYLRTVRLLSREQFFHRATSAKVRAVQMQSQVANMAARLTHYVAS
ncbi:protein ELC-like [Argentina anserina]|uniref:protein ELC-like n=1 Tax=Argentina anserina TaxID=57926 RepID=UPI002176303F|nr:protein ELC-like [Potentilla anserina]